MKIFLIVIMACDRMKYENRHIKAFTKRPDAEAYIDEIELD